MSDVLVRVYSLSMYSVCHQEPQQSAICPHSVTPDTHTHAHRHTHTHTHTHTHKQSQNSSSNSATFSTYNCLFSVNGPISDIFVLTIILKKTSNASINTGWMQMEGENLPPKRQLSSWHTFVACFRPAT